ncbi:hypothetical protein, partial [Paenibacillus polysaccharolyticus]|uniref:hypothetical protein n=1 Tax=Paenibacillus polysaccharolyticus TaxID=582692 RepID=UPI00280A65A1
HVPKTFTSFCKQNVYSLVVQFSKIKLVLATETGSFQQLLYNIMSEPTLQALFSSFFRSLFSVACRTV